MQNLTSLVRKQAFTLAKKQAQQMWDRVRVQLVPQLWNPVFDQVARPVYYRVRWGVQ